MRLLRGNKRIRTLTRMARRAERRGAIWFRMMLPRGGSVAVIRKEIQMLAIAHNLVRLVMLEAAGRQQVRRADELHRRLAVVGASRSGTRAESIDRPAPPARTQRTTRCETTTQTILAHATTTRGTSASLDLKTTSRLTSCHSTLTPFYFEVRQVPFYCSLLTEAGGACRLQPLGARITAADDACGSRSIS